MVGVVSVDKQRRRFSWHRVTFWGSAGVAITWVAFAMASPDGKIITVFSPEGHEVLRDYVRFNYPNLANKWGLNKIHVVPKSPSVAKSK